MHSPYGSAKFLLVVALVSDLVNLNIKSSIIYCRSFILFMPIKSMGNEDAEFIARKIVDNMNCKYINPSNSIFTQELDSNDIETIYHLKKAHRKQAHPTPERRKFSKLFFNYKR